MKQERTLIVKSCYKKMADFDMYTDETCEEAIKNFQERLKEADNLKKDKNGNIDYET